MNSRQTQAIDEIVVNAFQKVFDSILKDVDEKNFRHINESVFRYAFIKELPSDLGKEDEWKRIDLLLHNESGQYPIEFKFYDRRPLNRFDGGNPWNKGGPGAQNFREFIYSCNTLVDLDQNEKMKQLGVNFGDKYFILVAGDREYDRTKFADYYHGKHISTLNANGIRVKGLSKKEKVIGPLTVFGWVIKLEKEG